MRAARLVEIGKPLQIVDMPQPTIDPSSEHDDAQVIVKVRACGICGTDIHQINGTAKVDHLPITLGHEISGDVADVGRTVASGKLAVPTFQPGDRVAVNNVISCGECRMCLRGKFNFCSNGLFYGRHIDGGMAEYVKVPARNLFKMPRNVSYEEGAVIGCAVATAYHALRIGRVGPGDNMVVWGLGGVGLSLVQLARELSAAFPLIGVDVDPDKLLLAKELGADFAIDAQKCDPRAEILRLTKDEGADIIYDCAGIKDADPSGDLITLASLRSGGQLIVIATSDEAVKIQPHDDLGLFEKVFTGSCGNLPDEIEFLLQLVSGRRRLDLRKLITHPIALDEVNGIIEKWRQRTELIVRPVVLF
jgi:threonine dehydrogenase-like Zn-dependent dehydrogenase